MGYVGKRGLSVISWTMRRRHHHLGLLSNAVLSDILCHAPDAVALTGDVTNFGLPAEFRASVDWLDRLPAPLAIVPGNHDRMTLLPWKRGLGQWARWMPDRPEFFPYVRRMGGITLIGVNSAITSPPFAAYGRVGRRQLDRLGAILRRTHGTYRIVMIHHPPRSGLVSPGKALLDRSAFGTIVKASGAELILHGHSHDATLSFLPGSRIPVLGVSSASLKSTSAGRMAGWNLIEIRQDAGGWHTTLERRAIEDAGTPHAIQHRSWTTHFEQGPAAS